MVVNLVFYLVNTCNMKSNNGILSRRKYCSSKGCLILHVVCIPGMTLILNDIKQEKLIVDRVISSLSFKISVFFTLII